MTFAETHAAMVAAAAAHGHGTVALTIQAWGDGRVTWAIWDATLDRHVYGQTSAAVLDAYRSALDGADLTTLESVGACEVAS